MNLLIGKKENKYDKFRRKMEENRKTSILVSSTYNDKGIAKNIRYSVYESSIIVINIGSL